MVEVDAGRDLAAVLIDLKPDVVFNCLHGRWGEDGCVQGLLEWLRIPYTHSGVLASALAMDKQRSKEVYAAAGLPVVPSVIAPPPRCVRAHVMTPPYVVKPNNEGSSVGVYLVHEGANGPPQLAADMPEMVMVEAFAPGRELTTTVMGDRALTVTDILTDGWYDYDAKYKPGGSRHVVPADVPTRDLRSVPGLCPARAQGAGLPGCEPDRFPLGRKQGRRRLDPAGNQHPAGHDRHLACRPNRRRSAASPSAELCAWMVEDASCHR